MNKPRIFLSGGGTLGSVMPLLALWEDLQNDYNCLWVGSIKGVERELITKKGVKYLAVPSGKWRKYFSLKNLLTPFFVLAGLKLSVFYCLIYRPKLIIVSGSFISVPLVWAGRFLGVPIIVHQEDINSGLAGKLTIPYATLVTTSFEDTFKKIDHKNKKWVGNPVRRAFYNIDKEEARKKWKKDGLPMVLVLGGGLGSEKINQAVISLARSSNDKFRIIDITGKNKKTIIEIKNYTQIEQLGDEVAEVMSLADIIISRAGLSTLSELSVLGKPTILIPLGRVGQDENAQYFKKHDAALVVEEKNLSELKDVLLELLKDKNKQIQLSEGIKKIFPQDPIEQFKEEIKKILKNPS